MSTIGSMEHLPGISKLYEGIQVGLYIGLKMVMFLSQ